jgi:hypothetical protein
MKSSIKNNTILLKFRNLLGNFMNVKHKYHNLNKTSDNALLQVKNGRPSELAPIFQALSPIITRFIGSAGILKNFQNFGQGQIIEIPKLLLIFLNSQQHPQFLPTLL